jgi:hypothetical protein
MSIVTPRKAETLDASSSRRELFCLLQGVSIGGGGGRGRRTVLVRRLGTLLRWGRLGGCAFGMCGGARGTQCVVGIACVERLLVLTA